MTESGKEEIRADNDDIPVQEIVNDINASSHTHLPQDERIRRWNEAQARAAEKGTHSKDEFTTGILDHLRATLPPNPTQEKARKLYEWWQSGCGGVDPVLAEMTQDIKPYDKLHPYEQQRWAVLAKALGGLWIDGKLCHDLSAETVTRLQGAEQKYKNIPAGLSWAEYDNVLHPEEAGYSDKWDGEVNGAYIHDDDLTYQEWVDQAPRQRRYFWQFWRPIEVHTEYEDYQIYIRNNALCRKLHPEENLTRSSR